LEPPRDADGTPPRGRRRWRSAAGLARGTPPSPAGSAGESGSRSAADHARHLALQDLPWPPAFEHWSATGTADNSACVYGCSGSRKQRVALGDLDDAAEVHHRTGG